MNFDTKNWGEFRLGNLFSVKKAFAYNRESLPESQNRDNIISCVTRTANDNGCAYVADISSDLKIEEGNALTIGGEGIICFYQKEQFVCGTNISVLRHPNLDELNGLFISTIINFYSNGRFCYGRAFNKSHIENSYIKLPIDKNGDPDWHLMSKYINNILNSKTKKGDAFKDCLETKNCSNRIVLSDSKEWKEFKLINFFRMEAGRYYYSDEYNEGTTPYVSASDINNGVQQYIDIPPRFPANCITIGKVGCTTFYQDKPFCATCDVTVLIPKFEMNSNIGLFLSTLLNLERKKWSYGRQIRLNDCMNLVIKLPVIGNVPDWQYMDEFISRLPYADKIN